MAVKVPRGLQSLKVTDYTDRELLLILQDVADEDGSATTAELVDRIRIKAPDPDANPHYAKRCVSARYAAMKRMGYVQRDEDKVKWQITTIGRELAAGRLSKATENMLKKLTAAQRILVMI